jgi:hypothetical protein
MKRRTTRFDRAARSARRSHPAAITAGLAIGAGLAAIVAATFLVPHLRVPTHDGGQAAGADTNAAVGAAGPAHSTAPTPAARPVTKSTAVRVETPGYWSWALLDRKSGRMTGSSNLAETNTTESMVKAWIVADYLRVQASHRQQPPANMLRLASSAIRNSDDAAAQTLYVQSGGDAAIQRLIATCHLSETSVYAGWWSRTRMSARDAVRMGACIADGRAAGPTWTKWLLDEMRHVRGTTAAADQPAGGRWGIIDALPVKLAGRVAIKNGWTPIWADGTWHLNCLAIADDWILAVEARYPISLGLNHGAGICRTIAEQLFRH